MAWNRSWRSALVWLAVGIGCLSAGRVKAGGVEETVGGTIALGRAANYARVNDFMAVWQNPANLAISPRGVGLDLRLPIFNGCFDRQRNTTSADLDRNGMPGVQYSPHDSFRKVCNDAGPFPYGNAGAVIPLWKSLTLGAGFYTPSGIVRNQYGNDRIVTQPFMPAPGVPTPQEAPNRYLLLDRTVLAAFLMVGLGYAPIDRLRVGATLGWGVADIKYRNVSSIAPGFTDVEVVNAVHVRDLFIPRLVLSAAASPIDAMDLMLSFTYTGDISAEGEVDLSANGIDAPRESCRADSPGPHCRVSGAKLDVPYQRFELVLGGRYVARQPGRTRTIDALRDERWDAELDVFYLNTGHVRDYDLQLYQQGDDDPPRISLASGPTAAPLPLPTTASIPHRWRDSWGLRVGGDYTVLPNLLAARLGLSYESRAVPTGYMNIDYWPVARVGLHMGLTVRVRVVDLHLAYAHLFQETVRVPLGKGKINEISAIPTPYPLGVNEGSFTSRVDVLSLQSNYRF